MRLGQNPFGAGRHLWDASRDGLGQFALLALAAFALFKFTPAILALGLLLLATLLRAPESWRSVRRLPYAWAAGAYLAYLALHAGLGSYSDSHGGPGLASDVLTYTRTGFLPGLLAAYWLGRRPRLVAAVLILLPLGLLARIAYEWGDGHGYRILVEGRGRPAFGDSPVQFGLWALIGLLCATHTLMSALRRRGPWWHTGRLAGMLWGLAASGLMLHLLLASRTRAAWLVALVVIPGYVMSFWALQFTGRNRLRAVLASGAVLAAVLAGVWANQSELIAARMASSGEAIAMALAGDLQQAPPGSEVIRLRMFQEAWQAWGRAPVLGLGPGASPEVLSASEYPPIRSSQFDDFHNSALVMLVEMGVPGAVFFVLMFLLPLSSALRGLRNPACREPLLLASFGLLAVLGASLSSHVLDSYRGPFVLALLSGVCLAPALARPGAESTHGDSSRGAS